MASLLSSVNNPNSFSSFYASVSDPGFDADLSHAVAEFEEVKKANNDEIPDHLAAVFESDSALQPVSETHTRVLFLIRKMLILSDGKNRTDSDCARELNEHKENNQDVNLVAKENVPERNFSIGLTALTRSRKIQDFENDTHFNGQVVDNTPLQIRRTARNLFSRLAKLFLGRDAFNRIRNIVEQRLPLLAKLFWEPKAGTIDLRTLAEQQAEFAEQSRLWSSIQRKLNVGPEFPKRMGWVFESAKSLLDTKQKYEQQAYLGRIAFYATLTFSVIGNISGQRTITILGLGGLAVTFFWMNLHYDRSVDKYELMEGSLKTETGYASGHYHYALQQKQLAEQQQQFEQQRRVAEYRGQSL